MSIRLDRAQARLGEVQALRETTLTLRDRTVAVLGDNGSGKSTFARLLGGLIPRTGGRIHVLGLDPDGDRTELRRRVAYVFSDPDAQIVMPTVTEDVAFSLRGMRLSRSEKDRRVDEALDRFGLADLAHRSSYELSGGQKQLLALCGAFVREPELVIADEPTAYLDARNSSIVAGHLLGDTGHRLVLVTHDLALAARCEQAVLFDDGRVVASGASDRVIAAYVAGLPC